MLKTVIKESGIVILLLLAIVLILGIVFYDYIPTNKTVPIKIEEYALSENIQEELKESVSEEGQNIVKTFYIDGSDLDLYEAKNDYDKGKANPFADYAIQENQIDTSDNTISNENNVNINSNTTVNNTLNEDIDRNEVYINTPGKNY